MEEKMQEESSAAGNRPRAQRHLKNFLIDRSFQLGWVFRVALVTAIILGVMGYFLYRTLSESTEIMIGQALMVEGMPEDAQNAFIEQGEADKTRTVFVLGGSLLVLLLLLSLMTIVATHKIAGPAYKIRKLLSKIDGDHLQLWAKLRKGDELVDVFREFDDMVRRLRESRHTDVEELEKIRDMLASNEVVPASEALQRLADHYRDSVRME
jgi:sensor histidine kinase YesM